MNKHIRIKIAKWKCFWHSLTKIHRGVEYYHQTSIVILGKKFGLMKKYNYIGCNDCGKKFYQKDENGNRQK